MSPLLPLNALVNTVHMRVTSLELPQAHWGRNGRKCAPKSAQFVADFTCRISVENSSRVHSPERSPYRSKGVWGGVSAPPVSCFSMNSCKIKPFLFCVYKLNVTRASFIVGVRLLEPAPVARTDLADRCPTPVHRLCVVLHTFTSVELRCRHGEGLYCAPSTFSLGLDSVRRS